MPKANIIPMKKHTINRKLSEYFIKFPKELTQLQFHFSNDWIWQSAFTVFDEDAKVAEEVAEVRRQGNQQAKGCGKSASISSSLYVSIQAESETGGFDRDVLLKVSLSDAEVSTDGRSLGWLTVLVPYWYPNPKNTPISWARLVVWCPSKFEDRLTECIACAIASWAARYSSVLTDSGFKNDLLAYEVPLHKPAILSERMMENSNLNDKLIS